MQKRIALLVFSSMLPLCAAGSFSLQDETVLKVVFKGEEWISGEAVTFPDRNSWNNATEKTSAPAAGYEKISNRFLNLPSFSARREAALAADGREIEIGFLGEVPAYRIKESADVCYQIRVPEKRLAGMKFTAVTGRTMKRKIVRGVLPDAAEGAYLIPEAHSVSVLALEGGNGTKLVFDFNVEGVTSYSDFGPASIQGLWTAMRRDGEIIFSFGRNLPFYGGILMSRIRIFEGTFEDWKARHAHEKYSYLAEWQPEQKFAFSPGKVGSDYADGRVLSSKRNPSGWLNQLPVFAKTEDSGALYGGAEGRKPAAFQFGALHKGTYLLSLRFASPRKEVGPFSVDVNGTGVLDKCVLPAGKAGTLLTPVRVSGDTLRVDFSGNWEVSDAAVQCVFREEEDLKVHRGFWIARNLPEPSVCEKSFYYGKPPVYQTHYSVTDLAPHRIETAPDFRLHLKKESASFQGAPGEMAWRYDSVIGSLGPNNRGTFSEFPTPELKRRRIAEIADEGIGILMLNGFLSRHLYREHEKRVLAEIKATVAEAHRHGIRVIDHQDLTLLWNIGSGNRNIVSETPHLIRSVRTGLPTWGYCLVNPDFRREFFERIENEIQETDIDGLMVDEVSFFSPDFCGCEYCRSAFTRLTGLMLPHDETNSFFSGRNSPLRRAFQAFRMQMTGDFFVELRKRINRIKPNFTLMIYTTHYGWSSTYATLHQGASLSEAARGCDFLGTEIMSRNVVISARPILAYRKMKNSLRLAHNCPVFGLVYPGNSPELACFGWALNNMNRQNTWFIRPPSGDTGYIGFRAGNISREKSVSPARIAVLYSMRSKDYAVNYSYNTEPLGLSELLSDLRIDHEFILEDYLKDKGMRRFSTLIVPGCSNLADEQIRAIKTFAMQGGKVVLTSHSGLYHEFGMPRKEWAFKDVFGTAPVLPVKWIRTKKLLYKGEEFVFAGKYPLLRIPRELPPEVRTDLVCPAGRRPIPVRLEVKYGSGSMVWYSFRFGDALCEQEQSPPEKYSWNPDPELLKLAKRILSEEFSSDALFSGKNLPPQVLTASTEELRNQKRLRSIHFLNGCGRTAPDTVIPAAVPADFARPLTEAPLLTVRDFQAKSVTAASPDFSGMRPLDFRVENGSTVFLLPPGCLKIYTIVTLSER